MYGSTQDLPSAFQKCFFFGAYPRTKKMGTYVLLQVATNRSWHALPHPPKHVLWRLKMGFWVNVLTEDVPFAPPHVLAISTVSKSMCSICLPQPKTDDTSPTPIREFFWVLEVGFRVARWVYNMIFCMHGEKSLSWSNPAWPKMESHKSKTRFIFFASFYEWSWRSSSNSTTLHMTAVGFEPTPLRNGALSHRLRLLGQTVLKTWEFETADAPLTNCGSRFCHVLQNERAHPALNQGPADLQSAALTTELCTQLHSITRPSPLQAYL